MLGPVAESVTRALLPSQERDGFGGLAVARGRGRGRGDWSVGTPGGIQEITYTVPADKCGLVIGKGRRRLPGFGVPLLLFDLGAVGPPRVPPPKREAHCLLPLTEGAPVAARLPPAGTSFSGVFWRTGQSKRSASGKQGSVGTRFLPCPWRGACECLPFTN